MLEADVPESSQEEAEPGQGQQPLGPARWLSSHFAVIALVPHLCYVGLSAPLSIAWGLSELSKNYA